MLQSAKSTGSGEGYPCNSITGKYQLNYQGPGSNAIQEMNLISGSVARMGHVRDRWGGVGLSLIHI